jgi:hypothetical protein
MAIVIPPNVRLMLLCDEVLPDPTWPGRVQLNGLILQLHWPEGSTTPLHLERLAVLLVLAGGRGSGLGRVDCMNEETGELIFQSAALPVVFAGKDPSAAFPGRFMIRDCYFKEPGAYLVRFLLEGKVVAQQGLIVR